MEKERLFEIIQNLLKKYNDTKGVVVLEPEFIEEILFTQNEDGTKSINNEIFYMLRSNQLDMKGVSFKGAHIKNHSFNGFKNVEINIDEIPERDISQTCLRGVKLTGSLDGAYIRKTNFEGYIGNLVLNPQTIRNRDLYLSNLYGIIVNGSFDNILILGTKFKGAHGKIRINPQKVRNKQIAFTVLDGVELVGDYNELTGEHDKPCFDGCYIVAADFNGSIGQIEINPQTLQCATMSMCKGTGIVFTDSFDGVIYDDCDFKGCRYLDSEINVPKQMKLGSLSVVKK